MSKHDRETFMPTCGIRTRDPNKETAADGTVNGIGHKIILLQ
jgi:hypothetical protein